MILDEQALFSNDQKITVTAVSQNVVKTGGDIGKGNPVEILVQVTEDFATCTSLAVEVKTCDTEAGGYETLVTSAVIPVATLKQGYRFPIKFLPHKIKKFLQLNYVIAGSSATTGKIKAGIVDGVPESYND